MIMNGVVQVIYLILALLPSAPIGLDNTSQIRGTTHRFYKYQTSRVERMLGDASKSGIEISVLSGYRSREEQIALRKANCYGDIDVIPMEACAVPTAKPGQSMHEYGIALDLACGDINGYAFKETACYNWLKDNASAYHFYNLESEPWHWSLNGQ